MSDDAASDAEHTLDHLRDIRTRTRSQAHGGAWFPVAVIAGLLLASIGLYQAPAGDVVAQSTVHLAPYEPTTRVGRPAGGGAPPGTVMGLLVPGYAAGVHPHRVVGPPPGARRGAYRRVAPGAHCWARRARFVAVLAAMPSTVDIASSMGTLGVDWFHGLLTPLVPVALALIALGWTERSLALAVTGAWIGLVASWYGAAGLGRFLGWLTFVLSGFEGPALGSQVALFDRPAAVLGVMALPLVVATIQGLRSRS